MFRIAVCDNEEEELEETVSMVQSFLDRNDEAGGTIQIFSSAVDLLDYIEKNKASGRMDDIFDLYLLDIVMPEMTGIEFGRKIREFDKNSQIVYTTSFKEYGYEAFGVQASDYLLKPIQKEKLEEVLYVAWKKREWLWRQGIVIKAKEGMQNVRAQDIIYVENVERCAVYHLKSGLSVTGLCNRGRFEETVMPLTKLQQFFQPHKSYLVNMYYIREFRANIIILDDGTDIPISRNRKNETKKKYLNYLADISLDGNHSPG